jgi:hypothetical protein
VSVELVFNELSLDPLASGAQEARVRMAALVDAARALVRLGTSRNLRAAIDLRDFQLAADYRLAQWRNDSEVGRELRQYWRTISVKAPILRPTDPATLRQREAEQDFLFRDRSAAGLGGAWLLGGIALSLASSKDWDSDIVALTHRWLEESVESLSEETVEVRHASTTKHVEGHQDWLREQLISDARDGRDLWSRRGDLFPSLDFCESASSHVERLRAGEVILASVTKRLDDLQGYFRGWVSGPFDPQAIPARVSPESQATLGKYGREREFVCPDGQERSFSWHVRITPGNWRIYFFPENETRRGIIGYIGPHLPTVDYPT